MKVGLIARANDRGLGVQTLEAYRHYPFDRTLVITIPDRHFPDHVDRYDRGGVTFMQLDTRSHSLGEGKIKRWARGLDVVFSVETLYDWKVADWVREIGGRTVVQANPEFFIHRRKPAEIQPDVWAWPTSWRPFDDMPEGPLLPVPALDAQPPVAAISLDDPFTVLHVAGHRALDDRNGTDGFMEALRRVRQKVTVRVVGQDGQLPTLRRCPDNVTLELNPTGVADRWDLYRGVHLVVLPRRYGGLCLPAIEAATAGCAVAMPGCVPNDIWPIIPLSFRQGRNLMVQAGLIKTFNTTPDSMAYTIDTMARNRDRLAAQQYESFSWARNNTWAKLTPIYDEVFRGAMKL
jgi:hypothetical protein